MQASARHASSQARPHSGVLRHAALCTIIIMPSLAPCNVQALECSVYSTYMHSMLARGFFMHVGAMLH